MGVKTVFYAMQHYVQPLLAAEKLAMTICEIKGEEIGVVLELQDATKSHKVISFLADRKEELEQKPEKEEAASEAAEEKEDTVTENYTFGGYYEEQ